MIVGSIEGRRLPLISAAMLAVAVLPLGTAGFLADRYVAGNRLAGEQDLALRRSAIANLDLQATLDRVRDDTARTLQQLQAENDLLRVRITQLEQYQYSLQAAISQAPGRKGNRGVGARQVPLQAPNITPDTGAGLVSVAQPVAASPAPLAGSTNFRPPTPPLA